MTRVSAPDQIEVAPSNNVITVLSLLGCIASAMALLVLFMRSGTLGIDLLH
jgi:hypothetical protein